MPFPVTLPALTPQRFSAADAWGPTAAARNACRSAFEGVRNEGLFTPPSVRGSLVMPGNTGGITWSGYAFDPLRNLLIVNTNNLPALVKLIPRSAFDDSGLLLAAVLAGQGAGLLPAAVVADEVAAGRLVKLAEESLLEDVAYYLVYPSASHDRPKIAAFRSWITSAPAVWSALT